MKQMKKRKGFSLIELLVAIVVLAILGAITITAGTSAQRRARITSAMTVFDDYKNAFNTAVMDHAGLVNDREDAWMNVIKNGGTYSSKDGFARLVSNMNNSLSPDLKLVWNDDGYWESVGSDPWGGKYVMLECPTESALDMWAQQSLEDYWKAIGNKANIRCSIWCTGIDPHIIQPESGTVTVRDISVGIVLRDDAGAITFETHGATNGLLPFTDNIIHMQ